MQLTIFEIYYGMFLSGKNTNCYDKNQQIDDKINKLLIVTLIDLSLFIL